MDHGRTLLALDFDGVICDSVEECFLSSWMAYHELFLGEARREAPPEARWRFARMRPLIRTGEDYLVVQDLLARGEEPAGQEEFDAATRRAGTETLRLFRDLFYRARTSLLEADRRAWLGLNRIYPHMAAFFTTLPRGAPVWILSTKKPAFIAEILAAGGIGMPEDRIMEAVGEPKLAIVKRLLEREGAGGAILIEDQMDAIRGNTDPRIRVGLATWGYVKAEWLRPPLTVPLVTPEGFPGLAAGALSGLQP